MAWQRLLESAKRLAKTRSVQKGCPAAAKPLAKNAPQSAAG